MGAHSMGEPTKGSEPPVSVEVDARGLRCPLPVIRLAQAAREAAPGTEILVRSTDPAARADIPAWCRLRGQVLVEVREEPGHLVHVIRLTPAG